MRVSNPPSNPELLDALADDFVKIGYDLKRLVRLIATSRAYDRSSLPNASNERDRRNFARFYPERLPAEVLLDALERVTGVRETFDGLPPVVPGHPAPRRRVRLGVPRRLRPAEARERLRVRAVDRGEPVADARTCSTRPRSRASSATAPAARRSGSATRGPTPRRSMSSTGSPCPRPPTAEEREVCLAHLEKRRAEKKLRQGYEDLIWTVINTKEFLFNQ